MWFTRVTIRSKLLFEIHHELLLEVLLVRLLRKWNCQPSKSEKIKCQLLKLPLPLPYPIH